MMMLEKFVKDEQHQLVEGLNFRSTCVEAIPPNPEHGHAHESDENIVWLESFFTEASAIANDKYSGEARHTCM
jgi:hypothetical protein